MEEQVSTIMRPLPERFKNFGSYLGWDFEMGFNWLYMVNWFTSVRHQESGIPAEFKTLKSLLLPPIRKNLVNQLIGVR